MSSHITNCSSQLTYFTPRPIPLSLFSWSHTPLSLLLVPYPSLFTPGPIPLSLYSWSHTPLSLLRNPFLLISHCMPVPFLFTVRLLFSIARPILLTSLIVPTRSLLAHPFLLTSLLVPFHSLYYSSYHTHCTPRPISISFFLSLNS